MTETHTSNTSEHTAGGLPGFMARHRQAVTYAMFAAAVVFASLAIWLFVLAGEESRRWACIWAGLWLIVLSGVSATAGLFQTLYQPAQQEDGDANGATRVMLLVAGAAGGFATICLAAALTYLWWWSVAGGLKVWRHEWWRLGTCGLALFGGLAIMLISLQLARAGERTVPWMRRLLYGYNTVLTGLLLIAILGIVNVLTYVPLKPFKAFNTITDWTSAKLFSLSDASRKLLAGLDKPVKIYALVVADDEITSPEEHALLDNCRAMSDKIEVEYISPDQNSIRLKQLLKKYAISEATGLLIVYGSGPKEQHEFIKQSDMFPMTGPRDNIEFKGESLLMNKLSILSQHQIKTVIYVTQGNGEPDLKNTNERAADMGLGVLKTRLEQRNYEVRSLRLDAATKIPADAAAVIVARPTNPGLSTQALKDYLNPKDKHTKPGKVIVLEDVAIGTDDKMIHTPVDDLVASFGVAVKDDLLLTLRPSLLSPSVRVVVNQDLVQSNPVARAFQALNRPWLTVRTVEPKPSAGGSTPFDVTALLQAKALTLSQTNFREDMNDLNTDWNHLVQRANKNDVPVAVAVTAPSDTSGNPHARLGPQTPRMVVFGDTTWVTNPFVVEQSPEPSFDLFASTLAWLVDRPDMGVSAASKEHKIYAPQISDDTANYLRWVPLTLMFVGIVGLGGGIWAVRRR